LASLPLKPPIQPQLARSKPDLPVGDQWSYEPKYDGFRAIAFVDGEPRMIQSRGGKPLERYFPELKFPAGRYVIDGEIVIDDPDGGQDFDALQNRIHPAKSRIDMLAEQTPAHYVAFDLLAVDDESWLDKPFTERRARLEELAEDQIDVTPLTGDPKQAEPWLRSGEGVVAKDCHAPYRPGERTGMFKIKRVRTIDAVVAGWRPGKEPDTVGSLILGLYDDAGRMHVVGHSSGLKAAEKRSLVAKLAPYETGEVTFDHASGGRIRHGTKILRWREDKAPTDCKLEQMQS
jgi:ATP-dependent DNA ligase